MNLVVTGHVDHGKSTVVGRLLADTGSLPEGKLDAIRALCARNSKPFEYAFLLDALRDERAQGITIDAARVFFKSKQRDYLLLDAPGHSEFLRNMITGAARAEAALLVIDAREGVRDNSRRHGYLLSLLGIRQLAVIVNKMDLVDRSRDVFDRVANEYQDFLSNLQVTPSWFIPVSGMTGENIVDRAPQLAVVQRADRARSARRVHAGTGAGRCAVPHAGAGRLQVHRQQRRPPHRRRQRRDRPGPRRRRADLPAVRQTEPRQDDRSVRAPGTDRSLGGRSGGPDADRSHLCRPRRDRGESRREAAGRHHQAARERVLAGTRSAGEGQGVSPQAGIGARAGQARRSPPRARRLEPGVRRRSREGRSSRSGRLHARHDASRWRSIRRTCSGRRHASCWSIAIRSRAAASFARPCRIGRHGSAARCCSASRSGRTA